MRRLFLISAVILLGFAIGGYVFFNGERKAPIRYRTAVIERGSIVSVVTATGSINPVVSVQVGTQVSGMIKSLHADFNSIVKAGDVVVETAPGAGTTRTLFHPIAPYSTPFEAKSVYHSPSAT